LILEITVSWTGDYYDYQGIILALSWSGNYYTYQLITLVLDFEPTTNADVSGIKLCCFTIEITLLAQGRLEKQLIFCFKQGKGESSD